MRHSTIAVLAFAAFALATTITATALAASSAKQPWKILLTSDREGGSVLYSLNADGTGVQRLLRSPKYIGPGPSSPDGKKLLFNGNSDVFVMNANGSGQRNLTRHAAFDCCGVWSPDGRQVAFTTNRDGNHEIYVMNADGSGQRNLAASPSSDEFVAGWSRDGRTILFVTNRDGNVEIYAMDADGANPRNLSRHPLGDGPTVALSPDGRTIVFETNRDRNRVKPGGKVSTELWTMNVDGSGQRRLTRTPEFELVHSWSPDGRKIVFARFPSTPRWAFFVMNADGSGIRKVDWELPGGKR